MSSSGGNKMENNFRSRVTFISHLVICIVGICAIGYVGVRFILPALLPFLIAWGIAIVTAPAAKLINKKVSLPEKAVRAVLSSLIILSLLGGAGYLIVKLAGQARQLLSVISESAALEELFTKLSDSVSGIFGDGENAGIFGEQLKGAVTAAISSLMSSVGTGIGTIASSVPKFAVFLVITVISTVYFSLDLERINLAVSRILPEKIRSFCKSFKDSSLKLAFRYLRSYLLIMLITFSVMLVGFTVLRVRYALLLALVVAILDLLPVIGIGSILIPWSIWNFLMGNAPLGIGLLVLFGTAEVIRQLAEPKILGKSLGVHPLVMLVLLYVSYSLLGFAGIILLPVFAVIINTLHEKTNPSEVEESVSGGGE